MNGDPLEIYRSTVARVPAYRTFLEESLGKVPDVATREAFRALPLMDKTNYIMRYPLEALCLDGTIMGKHCFLRSSGTSGNSFYWPKLPEEEKSAPQGLGRFFSRILREEMRPTLVVIAFALGPWATGTTASWAFRTLAQDTPGLTVVTPGNNAEAILDVIRRLSPLFRQTLIFTYPPFAKLVMEQGLEQGLPLRDRNIMLIVGGEGMSEHYREHMVALLRHDPRDFTAVWSAYGSTDFADVGTESPVSIAMRRILHERGVAQEVLGTPEVPMLFQAPPSPSYFELVDGELVVSRMQGVPIVRYRTGDRVQFVDYEDMLARFRAAGHDPLTYLPGENDHAPMPWPFCLLYGRTDGMIFFYGANVTLDQVRTALEHPDMAPYCNGKFLLGQGTSEQGDPVIEVTLEDTPPLREADLKRVAVIFSQALARSHVEYAHYAERLGDRILPRILLAPSEAFAGGWKYKRLVQA